jgi:hypothetical protein
VGPLGMSAWLFVDPQKSNRVGLIVEVPDMETFENAMQSPDVLEGGKYDGVRFDTMVMLVEATALALASRPRSPEAPNRARVSPSSRTTTRTL